MRHTLCALLAGAACLLAQPASKGAAGGEVALFDGKSLAGWRSEGGAKWRVEAGAIVADDGEDGWLRSDKIYSDFVLSLEYRNSPKGNSGIFLGASKETNPKERCNPMRSFEFQINNEDPNWATGSIEYHLQRLTAVNPAPNQWHRVEFTLRGGRLLALIDGQKVLDGPLPGYKPGYIGLQHHKGSKIEFRNIRIRELIASR